MDRLYPEWRDYVIAAGLFVLMLVFFAVLSQLVLYPLGTEWWFAVSLALGVAAIPFVFRILSFLQKTRSSLEFKGIKIDFGQSLAIPAIQLAENLVEADQDVGDSGTQAVLDVARKANESTVVVVDLKSGKGWYKTRLFALAAAALEFGNPRIIAFVATSNGLPGSFLGFAEAAIVARAILRDNNYNEAFKRARTKYYQLVSFANDTLRPAAVVLQPEVDIEKWNYEGRPTLMALIIHELLYLEPAPVPQPAPGIPAAAVPAVPELPPAAAIPAVAMPPVPEPWIGATDIQDMLGDALYTEVIEDRKKDTEAIARFLTTRAEFVGLVRGGRFVGLVSVVRVLREILHSLIVGEK